METDCLLIQQLCGVPSVLWCLLLVEQGNRYDRLTIGDYGNCSVYRLYCGDYC